MKKILILFMFFLPVIVLSGQSLQDEFLGKWVADPFVIEQEDGLLISPKAKYSFPHLGITELEFLDSEFIVFTILETEYRAFYEIEILDFDNYHIKCIFKGGEEFLLKLVRSNNDWIYLYHVFEGSVFNKELLIEEEIAEEPAMKGEIIKAGVDDDMYELEADETPLSSLYSGLLSRKI